MSRPMRAAFTFGIVFMLACAVAAMCGGCTTPVEKAYTTRSLYNEGLKDLITARQTQVIDDPTFVKLDKTAHLVAPTLDELDRSALAGDGFSFSTVYSNTHAQIMDFLKSILKAKQPKG